jgi:hypothetical protein
MTAARGAEVPRALGKGPEPNFSDHEQTSRRIKLTLNNPKRAKATKFERRSFRKDEDAPGDAGEMKRNSFAAQTW